MKKCSRCGVVKSLEDFAKSSVKKDGRTYSCKVCIEIGRKERLAADPEKANLIREKDAARKREKAAEIYEKIKQRKESDTEYAERLKGYARKYANENREKELSRGRNYRLSVTCDDESREAYNTYMRQWVARNSERLNKVRRDRLKNDPEYAEKVRSRERMKYAIDPDTHRSVRLKSTYGITLDEYRRMYVGQEGRCAICDTHCPDHGKSGLVVDHCHNNGHVRKLLCALCNKGLGQFKDDVQLLRNAIEYLESTNQRG